MCDKPSVRYKNVCNHWLKIKMLWPITKQNIGSQESQTEYQEKEGQSPGRCQPADGVTRYIRAHV